MINTREELKGEVVATNKLNGELNSSVIEIEPNNQEKLVRPLTIEQRITPDKDYSGLSKVTVCAVDNTIDENIKSENIIDGVEILGVIGNFKSKEYAAGTNIEIREDGTINCTAPNTEYTAGKDIEITEDNVINCTTDLSVIINNIGDLTTLTTAEKGNLVDAINEVSTNSGTGEAEYTAGKYIEITSDNVINNKIPFEYDKNTNFMALSTNNSKVTGTLAIGTQAVANVNSTSSVVIGNIARSSSKQNVVIGTSATSNYQKCIVIGPNAVSTESNQFVIGDQYNPINKMNVVTSDGVKEIATKEIIGELSTLTTTEKTDLVKAINEINEKLNGLL